MIRNAPFPRKSVRHTSFISATGGTGVDEESKDCGCKGARMASPYLFYMKTVARLDLLSNVNLDSTENTSHHTCLVDRLLNLTAPM